MDVIGRRTAGHRGSLLSSEEPEHKALTLGNPTMDGKGFNWARKLDDLFSQPTMTMKNGPYVRKVPKSVFTFYYDNLQIAEPSSGDSFWSSCGESLAYGRYHVNDSIRSLFQTYGLPLATMRVSGFGCDENHQGVDYSAETIAATEHAWLLENRGCPQQIDVDTMGDCLRGEAGLDQMILAEGQLARCLLITPWPTAKLALLKMWTIIANNLSGYHACKHALVDIKRIAQFNMVKRTCAGAEWMFESHIKLYKARIEYDDTWMRALDAVDKARKKYWGDVAFDSLMCGIHGRSCSKWTTEPRDREEAYDMKLDYFYEGCRTKPFWSTSGANEGAI